MVRTVVLVVLAAAATAVVTAGSAPVSAQAPSGVLPGAPWTGVGASGWSEAELEEFADFPVLWLGPSAAGLNLQRIIRQNYVPLPPVPPYFSQNSISFFYGDCVGAPCALPGFVEVQEICRLPPSFFPEPKETIRGEALLQRPAVGLGDRVQFMLWSGRSTVLVRLPGGEAALEEAIAALHSPGAKPVIRPGDPLPAPDESDCERSVWEERVVRQNRSGIPAPEKPVPVPERAAAWTGFAENTVELAEVGDTATVTIVVLGLPVGVSGVHLAIAHPIAVRIDAPSCGGAFAAVMPFRAAGGENEPVARFPDEGVSVVGCFIGRGTDAPFSGAVMQIDVIRVAPGEATLMLIADERIVTRYFATGFAIGAGELGALSVAAGAR